MLSNAELSRILFHCRDLSAAADHLASLDESRGRESEDLLTSWTGPHADVFGGRADEDSRTMRNLARRLRNEADQWAHAWADTVNQINRERRQAAVDAEKAARGAGEQFIDIFVGDDSGRQVRAYSPVPIPTEANGFAPTGELETFD